jgi:hypothetical protein
MRGHRLSTLVLMLLVLTSCAQHPTHNAAGGYIDACGDLPGLLGDDC